MYEILDSTPNMLGEGPLWHPLREEFFWFDIPNFTLFSRKGDVSNSWHFGEHVSAAGWVDQHRLLIASETGFFLFDLEKGTRENVVEMEADNPATRSNDGRVDPFGGFWIGTMGKQGEDNAGAIYRLYRGELRKLFADITVPNAICFSPDGQFAYFTDTATQKIMRQRLNDRDGWPEGDPELWLDLGPEGFLPDGAVVDAQGNLWNAQWRAGRVAVYDPTGAFLKAHTLPAPLTTCPAFGGKDLTSLICTSARTGLDIHESLEHPHSGRVFVLHDVGEGQREHQVVL